MIQRVSIKKVTEKLRNSMQDWQRVSSMTSSTCSARQFTLNSNVNYVSTTGKYDTKLINESQPKCGTERGTRETESNRERVRKRKRKIQKKRGT